MLKFHTGKDGGHEFAYQSRDRAVERYHFLCWWVEFIRNYWKSSLAESVPSRDIVEHSVLDDFLRVKHPCRVFSPRSVYQVMP